MAWHGMIQAVLWTLWSRLVRLHSYLRQLLAETPAQKLHICSAVKREDWGVVVASIDAEVGAVSGLLLTVPSTVPLMLSPHFTVYRLPR